MNKQKLLEQNERFQQQAKKWLEVTRLQEFLSRYGEFHLEGSFCYGLMTEGDIDMYVLVEDFSRDNALAVFDDMIGKVPGIAGYKFHDYVNLPRPEKYPEGYKISLFTFHEETRWRFDIWFWTREQFAKIEDYPGLMKRKLDEEKKLKILHFKEFTKLAKLKVPSVKVYDAVLKDNVMTIEEFRDWLKR